MQDHLIYPIGSRRRSLFHFAVLLLPTVGILALLYLLILQLVRLALGAGEEDTFFALTLLTGGIFVALADGLILHRISGWLTFTLRDSAAGAVDNFGLRYRLLFKCHAVPWNDISRIEYFPGENGRIHVYVFGSPFPVRFGPTSQTGPIAALPDFLKSQMLVLNRVFVEHRPSALLSETDRNQKRELVAQALVLFSVLAWLGSVSLRQYYSYTRRKLPNVSEGRIYKEDNYGNTVYLTAHESDLLDLLEFSAPIFLVSGVLLYPRRRIRQLPRNFFPV